MSGVKVVRWRTKSEKLLHRVKGIQVNVAFCSRGLLALPPILPTWHSAPLKFLFKAFESLVELCQGLQGLRAAIESLQVVQKPLQVIPAQVTSYLAMLQLTSLDLESVF